MFFIRCIAVSTTWTSGEPSGFSQLSGLFSSTSRNTFARPAIPCWNCGGKLSREAWGTPSAISYDVDAFRSRQLIFCWNVSRLLPNEFGTSDVFVRLFRPLSTLLSVHTICA